MIKQINVTDGLVLNRATSVPKSILHQMLEKGLTPVWFLNFFSEFQVVPNKSPMNELNKRQETLSIHFECAFYNRFSSSNSIFKSCLS